MNGGHWSQITTVPTERFLPGTKLQMAFLTSRNKSSKTKTTLKTTSKTFNFNLRIKPELQACKRHYLANAMQVFRWKNSKNLNIVQKWN